MTQPVDIAVIGLGCRFPGAPDPDAFWALLRDGVDAITEVPPGRWDVDAFYDPDLTAPGTMNTRWGGFLASVDQFARGFFGISPGEASALDPQHRLLLEVSWEALENAGVSSARLAGSATGVFVGVSGDDYGRACFSDARQINAYYASGHALCFAANRISHVLDLRGPSLVLDTGCSASLYAVHLACQSLRAGESNLALCGGVNLIVSPLASVATSQASLMAADGRCKSFDARSDGYVRSEGCGMVVLKRLADALDEGDHIWGVIRGSAVNQSGRGNSLTAPDPKAQAELMRRALRDAAATPAQIDYVEAHGVGTPAADLAEAEALAAVFGEPGAKERARWLGAVKTNLGHLEPAAGIAALIKVLLCLEHEQIPPNLHFEALHPKIDFGGARFTLPTQLQSWARSPGRGRLAGINSFGLGGANAHLVVAEPPHRAKTRSAPERPSLLPLSAKSEPALRALAARYADHLGACPDACFADVCFTASTGRAHFQHRLTILCETAGEARAQLAAIASGGALPDRRPPGHDHAGLSRGPRGWLPARAPEPTERRQILEALGALYAAGEEVDWAGLAQEAPRQKVVLPTYPFERQRCWVQPAADERPPGQRKQPEPAPELPRQIQALPEARRQAALLDLVAAEVAEVLGTDSLLDHDTGLFELGLTSLMVVDLQNRLQAKLGAFHALPSTMAFSYPTITAIASYLAQVVFSTVGPAPSGARAGSSPRADATLPHATLPTASPEPIAIIGIGCRVPGDASSPEELWQLLQDGRDAISEVRPDRWDLKTYYQAQPSPPGKTYSRHGGFLRDVQGFDAEFFGISPREAMGLDPQQRLMLEVSWEALENAGVPPDGLLGSQTGVFVGVISNDYQQLQIRRDDLTLLNSHYGTGSILSALAGRVSYLLGLQGPSVVVDTACSSSLVAIHLACQSLRLGECRLALAGGVNVMLSPDGAIFLAQARALAADGRCKVFDESADGYVRSEGCGVVVLKRLSDARADGDRVLAVISGSAVNHDGASSGFTVPSGLSQQALLRQALASAGVPPAAVGYVEAHGTGTSLGDPIEAQALGAVLSEGRPADRPFVLGSVKSNLGHMEAAAGVTGLIKVVLALQHEQIPPNLHFKKRNPRISPDEVPAVIPTQAVPWPAGHERRIAGVSSFGLSGTNAHVIVEEAPALPGARAAVDPARSFLLVLSARSEDALQAAARSHQRFLSSRPGADLPLGDICYTAAVRRSHHSHRLAVVGTSQPELAEHLAAFLAGEARPGLSSGERPTKRARIVFVFPGQGSQWVAMGRQLLRAEPAFRAALERCDRALRAHTDWSLLEALQVDATWPRLADIDVIQPMLFAIEVALATLWRSWGVHPDAVIGHSMGEIAAAHVAGALSLEDAARVICQRSSLAQRLRGQGAMAVVELPLEEARALLSGVEDRVSVAVSNSPRSTVLSGEPAALEQLLAGLRQRNIFCQLVKVDFASHSPQVDVLRDDLLRLLAGLRFQPAAIPFYSTVTGELGDGLSLDAAYWVKNLRNPVLFSTALERALADGCEHIVEISPHPILLPAIEQIRRHVGRNGLTIPSLRREQDERAAMLASLGALHAAGHSVALDRLFSPESRQAPLPTYPWQRERYWFEDSPPRVAAARGRAAGRRAGSHPVLGEHVESPAQPGLHLWEIDIDPDSLSYVNDHQVLGTIVLPGMAYIAMALAAAEAVLGPGPRALTEVEFQRALYLPEQSRKRTVQTVLQTMAGVGHASVQIYSRPATGAPAESFDRDDGWVLHATARIDQTGETSEDPGAEVPATPGTPRPCPAPLEELVAGGDALEVPAFYQALKEKGILFGPLHQGIQQLQRRDGEALGRVSLPLALATEAENYVIHPAYLDACLQVGAAAAPAGPLGIASAFMPTHIDRLEVMRRPARALWSHARFAPRGSDGFLSSVRLFDDDGQTCIAVTGLEGRYLERAPDAPMRATDIDAWFYELEWQRRDRALVAEGEPRVEPAAQGHPAKWLIFADDAGVGEALLRRLEASGETGCAISAGTRYEHVDPRHVRIRALHPEDMDRLFEDALGTDGAACRGVVHLWSLGAQDEAISASSLLDAQVRSCASAAHVLQALARRSSGEQPRLWLVTQGAQRLSGDAAPPALAQTAIWGLGRVIAEEHPHGWGGLLDLDPRGRPEDLADWLHRELRVPDGEDEIALRGGQRHVTRLVPRPSAARATHALAWRPDGSYLITGGLGGIGLEIARWMVEQGARRLILLGRTPLPPRAGWEGLAADHPQAEQVAAIRALEALGASVHVAAVDVGDRAALEGFLDVYRRQAWPPIRGVVHAAAVVTGQTILQLDVQSLVDDLRPKLQGGWLLHQLLADAPLDFFVLFSSGSSVLRSPFVGSYAAANAWLDGLAHYRRALGKPALSVNWGMWARVGLAARRAKAKGTDHLSQGMGSFTPEQGLLAMKRLLERGATQTMVMPMDWQTWSHFHATSARAPMLAHVLGDRATAAPRVTAGPTLRELLVACEPGWQRRARLEGFLQQQIGQVLRLSPSKIGPHRPLGALGLDSLMGLELRNRLEVSAGLSSLPATLVWTYPTVSELAAHLSSRMGISLDAETPPPAAPAKSDAAEVPDDLSLEDAEALLGETLAMIEHKRSR